MQIHPRKRPKQKRAQATFQAILAATAQVLIEEGYEKANTNRVAEVAGVSIGTLYQYFPNKESLVLSIVEEHCEKMLTLLASSVQDLSERPLPEAIRIYIHAVVGAHRIAPHLHLTLLRQVAHLAWDYFQQIHLQACEIVQGYLELHREKIRPTDLKLAAFFLVTSVESITHRALSMDTQLLEKEEFEEEIVQLVLRYLLPSEERRK